MLHPFPPQIGIALTVPASPRGGGNQQEEPRFLSFVALGPQPLQVSICYSVNKTIESTFQGEGTDTEGPRDVAGSVWHSGKPDGHPPQPFREPVGRELVTKTGRSALGDGCGRWGLGSARPLLFPGVNLHPSPSWDDPLWGTQTSCSLYLGCGYEIP